MNSPATPIPGDVLTPVPNQGTTEVTPKPGGEFSAPTPSSGKFNPRSFVRKLSGLTGSGSSASSPTIGSRATLDAPPPLSSSKESAGSRQRKLFGRNKSSTSGYSSSSGASSGGENAIPSVSTPTTPSIASGVRADERADSYYEYKKEHDIIGIVMLEVQGADNLPKWANSESMICPCLP